MHFESVQSNWFATMNLIFVLGTKLGIGVFGSCRPLVLVQAMASFGFLVGFASRSRSKNGTGGDYMDLDLPSLNGFYKV